MIKPIQEILNQIVGYTVLNENASEVQNDDYRLLKNWADSIVDESESSFEGDDGISLYYMISSKSVEKTKNKIQ